MQEEAEAFLEWLKRSPQSGNEPIKVPGEWEEANRAARERDGIPLDATSWRQSRRECLKRSWQRFAR